MRAQIDEVIEGGRWRSPRQFDAFGPTGDLEDMPAGGSDSTPIVSFASNDYLGLSVHPGVIEAAGEALKRWGAGSGASRLVTGSRPVHTELERALADWKDCEAAVCFPTGFAANLGVLSVLGGPEVRVLSDELNHASIIDGCRLSKSRVSIYRHCDMVHLEELLGEGLGERSGEDVHSVAPTLVVTDTVFSMDGDMAPMDDIAELCRRYGALLLVDEAHAVLGPDLSGLADDDLTLVRVGTLSKTLGSLGGFVAGSQRVIDLMVNLARSYIFTTALTPADAAAALAAVEILRSSEGDALVARLRGFVDAVASPDHASPIVPVILGSEERALAASATLLNKGLWVPAIRPPTVPAGTSRLRVTLSAAHTDAQVGHLIGALNALQSPSELTASGALASSG
jgi:8-amino-7-oxononanoate synthase